MHYLMTHLGDLEVKVADRDFVLSFLLFFKSRYLLNMLMDQVDILHVGRYWSEVLCSTIKTHPGWPWGQGRGQRFCAKFFVLFFL